MQLRAVLEAHRRIAPFVRRTPLVRCEYLSAIANADVWLKLECQQPTGSFKVRGALNKVGMLERAERAKGVVTGSAGNHGLGVAYAAQCWGGVEATVFVPLTAPRSKVEKLGRFEARLHREGATYEEAHQAAEAFALETGAVYIQAYDDVDVIAGQGTLGLEILSDLPDVDVILVPVGGGGMVAGVASVAWRVTGGGTDAGCRVIGVQPQASPAALLSLRDGVAYDPYDHEPTIADGLAGGFGTVPLAIARDLIDDVLLVGEGDLRRAVYWLVDQEQLVVEASGAISIAPLLNSSIDVTGQKVVCILSGGNIETSLLRDILVEFSS